MRNKRLIGGIIAVTLIITSAGCQGGGSAGVDQSAIASRVAGIVPVDSQAQSQVSRDQNGGGGAVDDLYSGTSNVSGGSGQSQAQSSQAQPSTQASPQPQSSASASTRQVIYNQVPEIGKIVKFGAYEQDNDLSNGPEPIEWIILKRFDNGNYELMSKYCLDQVDYDTKEKVKVEESAIVKWMNNEFYNEAFNEEEKGFMSEFELTTSDRKTKFTSMKVSLEEPQTIKVVLKDDNARKAVATEYAKARGAEIQGGQCWYWLFPKIDAKNKIVPEDSAACVNYDGSVMDKISTNKSTGGAVRPVIDVNLDKMIKQ